MEITGVDYVYVSNIPGEQTAASFVKKVRLMWPQVMVDHERTDGNIEIYFCKDLLMDQHQEENGYCLNDEGEGCFMFYASYSPSYQGEVRPADSDFPAEAMTSDYGKSTIFILNAWQYTLVLPELLRDSEFSRKIEAFLLDSFAQST